VLPLEIKQILMVLDALVETVLFPSTELLIKRLEVRGCLVLLDSQDPVQRLNSNNSNSKTSPQHHRVVNRPDQNVR
jgi:hypothetical protein